MELIKPKEEIYSIKKLNDVKKYCHKIDIGSEITCYNITSKQVIKIFDKNINPNTKLLLPHNIYGNNTYVFIDKIIKCCNEIVAYTMQFIKGPNLFNIEATNLFYNLTYNMLLDYITILLEDSKFEANHGIQVFDCFPSNIILSPNGFKQIDCVDFKIKDKDPNIIEKENIHLMCQTIYDYMICPHLSTFISNHKLKPIDFTDSPYEFIKELKKISENYSDTEIITIGDTKKLSRRK